MELTLLDRTWPTLAENLAADEACLLQAEEGGPELLRFWHWPRPAVVLGAGGMLDADVETAECARNGVEIARRSSGGGTVLLGPGCLVFSLILRFDRDPALRDVNASYRYILERMANALADIVPLSMQGICDLVLADRKVGGNAQQRKQTCLLHHGTLLYNFDLTLARLYLKMPERQPDYRERRPHGEFLTNLPTDGPTLKRLLSVNWQAGVQPLPDLEERISGLLASRYAQREWVFRR